MGKKRRMIAKAKKYGRKFASHPATTTTKTSVVETPAPPPVVEPPAPKPVVEKPKPKPVVKKRAPVKPTVKVATAKKKKNTKPKA